MVKCAQCCKLAPVKLWACPCNKQRHMCPLHGNMKALCDNEFYKKSKVATHNPEVKRSTTRAAMSIDSEYATRLAGDQRMERKRKAPCRRRENSRVPQHLPSEHAQTSGRIQNQLRPIAENGK